LNKKPCPRDGDVEKDDAVLIYTQVDNFQLLRVDAAEITEIQTKAEKLDDSHSNYHISIVTDRGTFPIAVVNQERLVKEIITTVTEAMLVDGQEDYDGIVDLSGDVLKGMAKKK
jgi:hypothetical protein